METSPIVKIAGLNHWFGQSTARKQALFDINLTLARGSFTVLMGPSGSGKTTLLTLIGCLRAVQEGTLHLISEELNGADEARLVMMRRKLGFIFQAHNLHESLTAGQNVMIGAQVHPGVEAEVAADLLGGLSTQEREQLQRVLEPFYRLDPSRSRDTGGSGLGLHIARTLLQGQGATLQLSNRPGGGLRAEIRLQAAPPRG